MKSTSSNKTHGLFNLIITITFLFLATYVGIHHEMWGDEAHAWLLARDCSIVELLTTYLHAEGHPILWFLVIKAFQSLGYTYYDFFMLSIIISTVGVALFTYKSKFPWYIKTLFAFSYFTFYQYTIIVRSYCLILMLYSLLASIWGKRHKRIFLITFLLICLMNTTAYTYLFSASISSILLVEWFQKKKKWNENTNRNHIISFWILAFSFIATIIYVFPLSTNINTLILHSFSLSFAFFDNYSPYFGVRGGLSAKIYYLFSSLSIIAVIFGAYKQSCLKNKFWEMMLIVIPPSLFCMLKYYNLWHLGIILFSFIFCFWIHKMEKNKYILFLLIITLGIQNYWNISASVYDIGNTFCPAESASNFIKKYDYKNLDIYGTTIFNDAINAYFENNIFSNWNENRSFFYWDKRSKYCQDSYIFFDAKELIKKNKDMYIFTSHSFNQAQIDIIKEKYNFYIFSGHSYAENDIYESLDITILVRKDIDKIARNQK